VTNFQSVPAGLKVARLHAVLHSGKHNITTLTHVCRDLNLEFEIPFRELGFHGVPHKSTAFIMPTVNCLVELVESPATVVAMPAVAIVNLERVGFNLRNFDMVIVFKVLLSFA
jgi:nucleosome binding factor SPN SPT16 subunit